MGAVLNVMVNAQGTLNGSNIAEFQLGNIPDVEPLDQSSVYNQLNLSYTVESLSLKARIEQFYPSYDDDKSYTRLSQYRVQYADEHLDLNVGHLYTTLGRGLLLRTYEIPGSIWETRGYRVRYGFYEDLHGISVGYTLKHFELKALRGRVLDVSLPPTLNKDAERRPDLVEGGELAFSIARQKTGIIYMRQTNASLGTNYASIFYDGNIGKRWTVYGEFAFRIDSGRQPVYFADTAGFAGYASINYAYEGLGLSLEVKDYQNMSIGAGISDPPSLVREQSYRLLNRSTHVPILTNESGYQAELFYRFSNGSLLTLNNSLAKNKISSEYVPVYKEFFAEYRFPVGQRVNTQLFTDYASDPLVNEKHRYAAGGIVEINHSSLLSSLELEWQYSERITTVTTTFTNAYFSYTLSYSSKFSTSLTVEYTNDPVYVGLNKHQNYYPGLSVSYRPDNHFRLSLFGGKRRGGPACNSGVCYDVLDFEGIEFRMTTQF